MAGMGQEDSVHSVPAGFWCTCFTCWKARNKQADATGPRGA